MLRTGRSQRYAGPKLAQGQLKTSPHMNVYIYLCIYIYIYTCMAVSRLLGANGPFEQSNVANALLYTSAFRRWMVLVIPSKLGYHEAQISSPIDLLAFQTTHININTNNRFLLPRGGLTV
jgi:hypothetical protein